MGFCLGKRTYPNGLCLAPMAGYSDSAMRVVCHKRGAEYAVTEMISAKAICYGDKKTIPLARIGENEGDVAVQIFGADAACMARAAAMLEAGYAGGVRPVAIDINMGCPVHKIVSNGEGSALMREPSLAAAIVRAVVSAVSIPVTVKFRAGWDEDSISAPEFAKRMEDAGASLLTVHGRTRTAMYSGQVNKQVICDTVQAVSIPVLASGDVVDGGSARDMFSETNCAGVMVGRAAVGNPFVFSEIAAILEGRAYTPPTLAFRLETAYEQVLLSVADKGEVIAVREARKQLSACLHGRRGAAKFRQQIHTVNTLSHIRTLFDSICDEENGES